MELQGEAEVDKIVHFKEQGIYGDEMGVWIRTDIITVFLSDTGCQLYTILKS